MFSSDDDNQGLVLGVVFGVIALVVALVIGLGIHSRHPAKSVAAATVAPVAVLAVAVDGPSIRVGEGVVVFYFTSGKAELADGAAQALGNVATAVSGGKMAVISGFHDASGDAAVNAELAKQRAMAVRAALVLLGVAEEKIELKKPEQTQASGPAAEARRVEVTLK